MENDYFAAVMIMPEQIIRVYEKIEGYKVFSHWINESGGRVKTKTNTEKFDKIYNKRMREYKLKRILR